MPTAARAALLLAMLSALRCGLASAAHPLVTEDTGTQKKNNFQLELNAESSRDHDGNVLTRGFQPAAVLAYGLLDNLDLQIGRSYLRQVADPGGSNDVVKGGLDTSIDLKWRFFESGDVSIGLKPGITLATGDEQRGLGSGKATLGGLLIGSWETEGYAVHAHAGWRQNNNSIGQRRHIMQLAAAAVLKASAESRLILDLSRTTNPDRASSTPIRYLTLGYIVSPRENIDLDIGWRRAASAPALDHALMLGATLRW